MVNVSENITRVLERIAAAARRSGRRPEDITLVAVTKTVPVERIREAVACGLKDLGENRVQELLSKQPYVEGVNWHLIGHLQRNKVRQVWDRVCLIHSVDSLELAREINKRATAAGRRVDILLEVNIAGEESKFGLVPDAVIPLVREIAGWPGLHICGLMTVAPLVADPEEVRPVFLRLAALRREVEALRLPGVDMAYLSMGMTNDFEVAIEAGANMVRIGSAIFGSRDYQTKVEVH
ncbi:Pyridoxal phosphate homeostasis protein [Moorella thermoacetica]|uniref:YggS family pyridoxal phosphate-dependent enzyme n=1 Tax=Neomoorella thermoacetica TaxID=1525 RepID=UPI0011E88587|nr:YggS family pyridoxal phosphate-dependent enzyme [Moorella thermoacetica]TYL08891.1 Pyridoxal phosphate homeostasis protein [Moorella thermoacetica]